MPRCGSILQAGTCQILSLAENPRWSRVWQFCPPTYTFLRYKPPITLQENIERKPCTAVSTHIFTYTNNTLMEEGKPGKPEQYNSKDTHKKIFTYFFLLELIANDALVDRGVPFLTLVNAKYFFVSPPHKSTL